MEDAGRRWEVVEDPERLRGCSQFSRWAVTRRLPPSQDTRSGGSDDQETRSSDLSQWHTPGPGYSWLGLTRGVIRSFISLFHWTLLGCHAGRIVWSTSPELIFYVNEPSASSELTQSPVKLWALRKIILQIVLSLSNWIQFSHRPVLYNTHTKHSHLLKLNFWQLESPNKNMKVLYFKETSSFESELVRSWTSWDIWYSFLLRTFAQFK